MRSEVGFYRLRHLKAELFVTRPMSDEGYEALGRPARVPPTKMQAPCNP